MLEDDDSSYSSSSSSEEEVMIIKYLCKYLVCLFFRCVLFLCRQMISLEEFIDDILWRLYVLGDVVRR